MDVIYSFEHLGIPYTIYGDTINVKILEGKSKHLASISINQIKGLNCVLLKEVMDAKGLQSPRSLLNKAILGIPRVNWDKMHYTVFIGYINTYLYGLRKPVEKSVGCSVSVDSSRKSLGFRVFIGDRVKFFIAGKQSIIGIIRSYNTDGIVLGGGEEVSFEDIIGFKLLSNRVK